MMNDTESYWNIYESYANYKDGSLSLYLCTVKIPMRLINASLNHEDVDMSRQLYAPVTAFPLLIV